MYAEQQVVSIVGNRSFKEHQSLKVMVTVRSRTELIMAHGPGSVMERRYSTNPAPPCARLIMILAGREDGFLLLGGGGALFIQ